MTHLEIRFLDRMTLAATTGAVLLVLSLGGCPETAPLNDPDGNADDAFQARRWAQLQGDEEGTGFNFVETTYALPPLKRWTAAVGPIAFSSPVIAPDRTIYVGTIAGEVVALNADGSERWRTAFAGESILTTPAVDEDGNIFVITSRLVENGDHDYFANKVRKLSPAGAPLAESTTSFSNTRSSPKLWFGYVMVNSPQGLFVFDGPTLALISESNTYGCFGYACGSSDGILDFIVTTMLPCILTLGTIELLPGEQCFIGFHPSGSLNIVGPSVAIVDQPSLAGNPLEPIIVTTSSECVSAFRFRPNQPNPLDRLDLMWTKLLFGGDCDDDRASPSTPAVIVGGQVVVGDAAGRVRSFDIQTGAELWDYEAENPVVGPPVAFLRQIYVPTSGELVTLDSDGAELSTIPLRGYGGGAALSRSFLYVATSAGIHTFGLDPSETFSFDGTIANDAFFSSTTPALADDGSVYVATPDGFLVAYSSSGVIAPRLAPTLAWQAPVEGQQVSYRAGLDLSIRVPESDGERGIRLTVSSDIDGQLCDVDLDQPQIGNSRSACRTGKPLQLGLHTLTAFATNADGSTRAAAVTVEATNSPPIVAIAQPLDQDVLAADIPATLTATVSDADEPAFDAGRVVWTSSLDGPLGAGLSVTRTLSVGTHTLTAAATDERGLSQTASVQVTVSRRVR